MRFDKLIIALLFLLPCVAFGQTIKQNTGWGLFMNNTRINEKWGAYLDVQVRSHDDWDGVRSILVRPGVQYFFNKNHNLIVGYLYTPTFLNMDGFTDNVQTEHRIWEQYIFTHNLKTAGLTHRARLEQRFIEGLNGGEDIFSQRFRYFFRAVIPFRKPESAFSEGFFGAIQDEVFLNIQNKDLLNGRTFDQNRAYGALGYRFNKALDVELGYMNQAIKGRSSNTVNNIVQLAVYTRF
ncbi:DUF2490 domain-containing protein [Pedobacter sp. SYP-B3415]|uniref:DUF2490 domain-containing protein n=1 Tax=Pedobacter sp. SYP-B3415 TaxID=2496641 RepID=UPI00101D70BB|nr:DUF2490 domain-containing protein [Pedobacter sp. SYP-B3415]